MIYINLFQKIKKKIKMVVLLLSTDMSVIHMKRRRDMKFYHRETQEGT